MYSFDIWYVSSPSGPLQRLFKLCTYGQNEPHHGFHRFYVEFYTEIFLKQLSKKTRRN